MIDYLVVGQGLAGTVFAWQAIRRGKRVLVIDREDQITSSKVAAGIVNPVTGKRLVKTWRFDELWPVARDFYQGFGAKFFREIPVIRLFENGVQAAKARGATLPADFDRSTFDCRFGGLESKEGGQLDVAEFLRHSRERFIAADSYRRGEVTNLDEVEARCVVFCQGSEGRDHPLFDRVPLRPGKGEILDLNILDLAEHRIVNRGKWLLPLGEGRFRAGATFTWDQTTCEPTADGRAEIESGLREMLKIDFAVTGASAAFRPMGFRGIPRLGRHPEVTRTAYFNGLGSKGVLVAPFFARQLLDHLEDGKPLDREVDIARFWA